MASTALFQSSRGAYQPATNTCNHGGGTAYALDNQAALAQYVATGCLRQTWYASAEAQLDMVLKLLPHASTEFVAKLAVYARKHSRMKDMPALLLAWLAAKDGALAEAVFERVVDNGRMLRNFVQILRSGVVGRKSLGTRPKRLVQRWLTQSPVQTLLNAAAGQQPSLADVVKMVHPKATDAVRNALYAWLIGREYNVAELPQEVRDFEAFKADPSAPLPNVPWMMLTALPLTPSHWTQLAKSVSWQTLRMNLNTFLRHEVFKDNKLVQYTAQRLADVKAIRASHAQPFQLLAAWRNADPNMPAAIVRALEDAMESAIDNVPILPGQVVVCVDVSGSMASPLSGYQKGASSKVSCIDVAALIGASFNRRNHECVIVPFAEVVKPIRLNPRDSVATQAEALVRLGGGGTNIGAAMSWINEKKIQAQTVIVVSDNQSWLDSRKGASLTMREFAKLKVRQPAARLVCIDLQPYADTQAPDGESVLNVGGFSDAVFSVIAQFVESGADARHWVEVIEAVRL